MDELISIAKVKASFARLIARVEAGDEVVITRDGQPVARLVPYASMTHRRRPGRWRDDIWLAPDWDSAEVNSAIEQDFEA